MFACAHLLAAWFALAAQSPIHGMLISRQLSERAHLAIGDVVVLSADQSQTRAARFRVEGISEPVADPMNVNLERLAVRLHLPDLIALTANPDDPLSSEAVSSLNVTVTTPQA